MNVKPFYNKRTEVKLGNCRFAIKFGFDSRQGLGDISIG